MCLLSLAGRVGVLTPYKSQLEELRRQYFATFGVQASGAQPQKAGRGRRGERGGERGGGEASAAKAKATAEAQAMSSGPVQPLRLLLISYQDYHVLS